MTHLQKGRSRIPLKAVPRPAAVKIGKNRRFQVDLETRGVLSGDELVSTLAEFGFNGDVLRARMAIMVLEEFIEKKLSEGYQVDLGLASFVPRLSGALTTRDADPESDGLYVQGTVSARSKLRQALKDKVDAVNVLARKAIRIFNVLDLDTQRMDEIEAGHTLSVAGQDIAVDADSSDEGFWIEKRSGRRGQKASRIQKAKVLQSDTGMAKIVFPEPIPCGTYNIVVYTRCGEGHAYKLQHVGHPVRAV